MTLKEYYLLTKTTTKHLFKIVSAIFGGIFVVLVLVFAIRDSSSPDMGSIQMMIANYLFVYGLTIWIFFCAILSAYFNANGMIKLYNSIPVEIRERFLLALQDKQLDIKYNYLSFEIVGLCSYRYFYVDRFQKNVRIILYSTLGNDISSHKRKVEFDKKHMAYGISLHGLGLLKSFSKDEWSKISTDKIEQLIEKMKLIEQKEKALPYLTKDKKLKI